MKNKIKAVIFDMDGIIIDSEFLQTTVIEKVLKSYGVEPKFDEMGLLHKVGFSGLASFQFVLDRQNLLLDVNEFMQKVRAEFVNKIKSGIPPMKGFTDLINLLKKNNFLIAVASNRLHEHVILVLDKMGVKEDFAVILGKMDHLKHKPEPDIYLEAAKLLKISPKYCVAIEDSDLGVISAKAAGMKVIAVPHKYTAHHDFSKADKVVHSLEEIDIKLIKSL